MVEGGSSKNWNPPPQAVAYRRRPVSIKDWKVRFCWAPNLLPDAALRPAMPPLVILHKTTRLTVEGMLRLAPTEVVRRYKVKLEDSTKRGVIVAAKLSTTFNAKSTSSPLSPSRTRIYLFDIGGLDCPGAFGHPETGWSSMSGSSTKSILCCFEFPPLRCI